MMNFNIKKIALTLSIAAGTFYVPASFANCTALICLPSSEPTITCLFGDIQAYNNGTHTECNPKDTGCEVGNFDLQEITEGQCNSQGGTVVISNM